MTLVLLVAILCDNPLDGLGKKGKHGILKRLSIYVGFFSVYSQCPPTRQSSVPLVGRSSRLHQPGTGIKPINYNPFTAESQTVGSRWVHKSPVAHLRCLGKIGGFPLSSITFQRNCYSLKREKMLYFRDRRVSHSIFSFPFPFFSRNSCQGRQ